MYLRITLGSREAIWDHLVKGGEGTQEKVTEGHRCYGERKGEMGREI